MAVRRTLLADPDMIRRWLLALSQRAVRKAPAKQHGKARSPEAIRVKLDLWQYRACICGVKLESITRWFLPVIRQGKESDMKRTFITAAVAMLLMTLVFSTAQAAIIRHGWYIDPWSNFSRNGATCKEEASCFVCGENDPNAYNYHYSRARVIKESELNIISDSGRCYDNGTSQTSYASTTAPNAALYSGRAYWGDVY